MSKQGAGHKEFKVRIDVELPEEEVTAVATIGGLVDLVLRQKQL